MRHISIDFISRNDIRICIDGEKIADVAGFSLEIKEGESPSYSIQKNVFPKTKEKGLLKQSSKKEISLWRTVRQAAKALQEEDPKTAITDSVIRRLMAEDAIKSKPKAKGSKVRLVDLNEIKRYFDDDSDNIKQRIKPIF